MGLREELQADLAEAFDTDLADAVRAFRGEFIAGGYWDPKTETNAGVKVTYTGRGVFGGYAKELIDNINIMAGDVKLTCLTNEIVGLADGQAPDGGHDIYAIDLMTGKETRYTLMRPATDPAGATYSLQLRMA